MNEYRVHRRTALFCLVKERHVAALDVVRALPVEAHVDTEKLRLALAAGDLKWALMAHGHEPLEDDAGNFVDLVRYPGPLREADERLLRALSPFVAVGSYLEMQGADGRCWQWAWLRPLPDRPPDLYVLTPQPGDAKCWRVDPDFARALAERAVPAEAAP